ncbi:MAG TPA: hypothetical protein VGW40_13880 [Allosphingosinicella sp.]|nr:hypothetical protein [Allosphingosinicella sp.]
MPVANDTAGGNIPRLSDHYSGRMTCDRGDISVRMSVFADGRGKLTVAPPSYGVDFDISLRENERGVIRLEPTSALNTTSYIARRYNVPLFSATMRQNDIGLYGETTVPGCGPLILVAHSSAIPLTPDQFNRLTERLTEEMLRPKP